MLKNIFMGAILMLPQLFFASTGNQNIRGRVVERETQKPLPGVNIILQDSDNQTGTSTDKNGEFILEGLQTGRHTLAARFIGYEPKVISDILLIAGKETILKIELQEDITELDAVEVNASKNKSEPINKMASISARSFSVEETKRYAGGFNDPARMAANYAGIVSAQDGGNEIMIRGNSPAGLVWRLEGIDIPNPNHFASEGSSGGPIGLINTNMLDNSDFFTGAWPSEYGNALSGIFDIKMRNGNNYKREYSFRGSVLGTDISLEGPFKKGGPASYLFNYRYSTLELLSQAGLDIAGDAVPKFQDLAFKVHLPTGNAGTFSIFGIAGKSDISEGGDDEDYKGDFGSRMLATGISHLARINGKAYIKTSLAYTAQNMLDNYDIKDENDRFIKGWEENLLYTSIKINSTLNIKLSERHSLKTGGTYSLLNYDLNLKSRDSYAQPLLAYIDQDGSSGLSQAFVHWKYRITSDVTLNAGLHSMYFVLNETSSLEPRLGMRWEINEKNVVSFGAGIHGKMEALSVYLLTDPENEMAAGSINRNLGFSKSAHFVVGYEHAFSPNLIAKTEVYYQHLYDIPIEEDSISSFSMINQFNAFSTNKLENAGKGYNVGIDLTLEKFFSNNYYFMVTGSLFDSRYAGSDEVWRQSRFNSQYVVNALGGKEFKVGKKGRILSLNLRGNMSGGLRYSPIDLEQSRIEKTTVRNDQMAFSKQFEDFFRLDFKLRVTTNREKSTHHYGIDIQNLTNRLNVVGNYYDEYEDQVDTWTQMGIIPEIYYRIDF